MQPRSPVERAGLVAIIVVWSAALALGAAGARAEEIVLRDGTVVKGELVGYEQGVYIVKIGKLVERFSDPAYQRSMLEGVRGMQEKLNPGQPNPMIDQLRVLFDQLNTVRGTAPGGAQGRPPGSPGGRSGAFGAGGAAAGSGAGGSR
jgi:hypothetical protein